MWEGRARYGRGLDGLRKQAEQAAKSKSINITLPWLLLQSMRPLVSLNGKDDVSGCVSLSCPCCFGSWFLTTAIETKLGSEPRLVSSSQQTLRFLISSDPLLLDFWTVDVWKNVSIVLSIGLGGLTTVNCSNECKTNCGSYFYHRTKRVAFSRIKLIIKMMFAF